jgi:hypothetical protein
MYMLMPSPSWLFVVVQDRNILEIEVSMGLFLWITMGWGDYLPEIIKQKLWEVMQYMVDIIYIYITIYIYIILYYYIFTHGIWCWAFEMICWYAKSTNKPTRTAEAAYTEDPAVPKKTQLKW